MRSAAKNARTNDTSHDPLLTQSELSH